MKFETSRSATTVLTMLSKIDRLLTVTGLFFVGVFCVALLSVPRAQAEPEELVVIGTAPEKIEMHVSALLDVSVQDQIARWNDPLCLNFSGLPDQFAGIIRKQLTSAAEEVLVEMAGEGCSPNVIMFFSTDAQAITEQVVDHFDVQLRDAGHERVQRFVKTDAAIRWISTINPCGFGCALANSRIRASSAPSVQSMLLVVDVDKIQQRNFKDIANYLAFVILANPSPVGSPSVSSILGLFTTEPDSQAEHGLSLYDDAFLEALYDVPMDRFAKQQQSAIAGRMLTIINGSQE